MRKFNLKSSRLIIILVALVAMTVSLGVFKSTIIPVVASGRFNLPLSWILTPSGISVDQNNDGIIDAGVPSGMIAIFDTDCPFGWTRVTALDGKFLVASSTYNAAAGGNNSITLTVSNLPSHTHEAGTLVADSAGAHTHTIDPPNTNTSSVGDHRHTYSGHWYYNCSGGGGGSGCWITSGTGNTSYAGAHSHSVNIGPFNSGSAGDHTHTISGSTGATGSGTPFDNRPAFATIVLCKKD